MLNEETTLVKLDKARLLLSTCRNIDEAKEIRDKAEALRNYARQRDYSLESQNYCAEIKLRAERRIGEFSMELPKNERARTDITALHDDTQFKTDILKDAGLNRVQAHRFETIASLPEKMFEEHIQKSKEARKEITTAAVMRIAKHNIAIEKHETLKEEKPSGKYNIIYADPPWSYADQGCNGAMGNQYKGMSIEDICAMGEWVKSISDDNCILFLWATYPMLKEALMVMEAWGFEYKTIAFQWVKMNKVNKSYFYGLGRWTRGNTEPCLLAVKGKPQRIAKDVFQIIDSPVDRHSRKPDETRRRIVRLMGDLPRIELFARERKEGWEYHGNELFASQTDIF